MKEILDEIDKVLDAIARISRRIKKATKSPISSTEDREIMKSLSMAWFSSHRENFLTYVDGRFLETIDLNFHAILEFSEKRTRGSVYCSELGQAVHKITYIRKEILLGRIKANGKSKSDDRAPDFSKIISDATMRGILERRWIECVHCVNGNAPLAGAVMMGGLLEALILARIQIDPKKADVFKASCAPKDGKTGNVLILKDWKLYSLIEVAHELKWISTSAKDVADIIRDYRNYIHPHKEHADKMVISPTDASLFWEIFKSVSRQIIT